MTHSDFRHAMMVYCAVLGASETSGGRTRFHNEKVGGVAHSAHLAFLAEDVVYDRPQPERERQEWADRLGLRLVVEDDHDHLQPKDWKAG